MAVKKEELIKLLESHGYDSHVDTSAIGRATLESIYGITVRIEDSDPVAHNNESDFSNFWTCTFGFTYKEMAIVSEFPLVKEGKIQYNKLDQVNDSICEALLKLNLGAE